MRLGSQLVISYYMNAATMGEFTKDEFSTGAWDLLWGQKHRVMCLCFLASCTACQQVLPLPQGIDDS